jgi:hypothetical protein
LPSEGLLSQLRSAWTVRVRLKMTWSPFLVMKLDRVVKHSPPTASRCISALQRLLEGERCTYGLGPAAAQAFNWTIWCMQFLPLPSPGARPVLREEEVQCIMRDQVEILDGEPVSSHRSTKLFEVHWCVLILLLLFTLNRTQREGRIRARCGDPDISSYHLVNGDPCC